jgi:hypothetical protein
LWQDKRAAAIHGGRCRRNYAPEEIREMLPEELIGEGTGPMDKQDAAMACVGWQQTEARLQMDADAHGLKIPDAVAQADADPDALSSDAKLILEQLVSKPSFDGSRADVEIDCDKLVRDAKIRGAFRNGTLILHTLRKGLRKNALAYCKELANKAITERGDRVKNTAVIVAGVRVRVVNSIEHPLLHLSFWKGKEGTVKMLNSMQKVIVTMDGDQPRVEGGRKGRRIFTTRAFFGDQVQLVASTQPTDATAANKRRRLLRVLHGMEQVLDSKENLLLAELSASHKKQSAAIQHRRHESKTYHYRHAHTHKARRHGVHHHAHRLSAHHTTLDDGVLPSENSLKKLYGNFVFNNKWKKDITSRNCARFNDKNDGKLKKGELGPNCKACPSPKLTEKGTAGSFPCIAEEDIPSRFNAVRSHAICKCTFNDKFLTSELDKKVREVLESVRAKMKAEITKVKTKTELLWTARFVCARIGSFTSWGQKSCGGAIVDLDDDIVCQSFGALSVECQSKAVEQCTKMAQKAELKAKNSETGEERQCGSGNSGWSVPCILFKDCTGNIGSFPTYKKSDGPRIITAALSTASASDGPYPKGKPKSGHEPPPPKTCEGDDECLMAAITKEGKVQKMDKVCKGTVKGTFLTIVSSIPGVKNYKPSKTCQYKPCTKDTDCPISNFCPGNGIGTALVDFFGNRRCAPPLDQNLQPGEPCIRDKQCSGAGSKCRAGSESVTKSIGKSLRNTIIGTTAKVCYALKTNLPEGQLCYDSSECAKDTNGFVVDCMAGAENVLTGMAIKAKRSLSGSSQRTCHALKTSLPEGSSCYGDNQCANNATCMEGSGSVAGELSKNIKGALAGSTLKQCHKLGKGVEDGSPCLRDIECKSGAKCMAGAMAMGKGVKAEISDLASQSSDMFRRTLGSDAKRICYRTATGSKKMDEKCMPEMGECGDDLDCIKNIAGKRHECKWKRCLVDDDCLTRYCHPVTDTIDKVKTGSLQSRVCGVKQPRGLAPGAECKRDYQCMTWNSAATTATGGREAPDGPRQKLCDTSGKKSVCSKLMLVRPDRAVLAKQDKRVTAAWKDRAIKERNWSENPKVHDGAFGSACREAPSRESLALFCPAGQKCSNGYCAAETGAGDWTFGTRHKHCVIDRATCHNAKLKFALDIEVDAASSESVDLQTPWSRQVPKMRMPMNVDERIGKPKLGPGEMCGTKELCKELCVDPSNADTGDDAEYCKGALFDDALKKMSTGLKASLGFDVPKHATCKSRFCWSVKAPKQCIHRPRGLNEMIQCHSGLQCVAGKCAMPPRAAKKHLDDTLPDGKITTPQKSKCWHKCQENKLCTSPPGGGLQLLTRFKNAGPQPSQVDEDTGESGEEKDQISDKEELHRGMFSTEPVSADHTRTFATGMCFECKTGLDGHYRCPVEGRRIALSGPLPFAHSNASAAITQALSRRLDLIMYGGMDMCFHADGAGDAGLGPVTGLNVSPRKGETNQDWWSRVSEVKEDITAVVCNERVEVPVSSEPAAEVSVRYAATMILQGQFRPGYLDGVSAADPEQALFDFGFEITATTAKDGSAHITSKHRNKLWAYNGQGGKDRDETAVPGADLGTACSRLGGFIQGNRRPTQYRDALLELYTSYLRKGSNERGRVQPCKLDPNMDFRLSGAALAGDDSGHTLFFGKKISLSEGGTKTTGTNVANLGTDAKSNSKFTPCYTGRIWEGKIGEGRFLCSGDKPQHDIERMAPLLTGKHFRKGEMDEKTIARRIDDALTYVMHVMTGTAGGTLFNKASSVAKQALSFAKNAVQHGVALVKEKVTGAETELTEHRVPTLAEYRLDKHMQPFSNCDGTFWTKVTEQNRRNWGVVDESVFVNTFAGTPGTSSHSGVIPGTPEGEVMYGATVCGQLASGSSPLKEEVKDAAGNVLSVVGAAGAAAKSFVAGVVKGDVRGGLNAGADKLAAGQRAASGDLFEQQRRSTATRCFQFAMPLDLIMATDADVECKALRDEFSDVDGVRYKPGSYRYYNCTF